jgi:hypothetical protein
LERDPDIGVEIGRKLEELTAEALRETRRIKTAHAIIKRRFEAWLEGRPWAETHLVDLAILRQLETAGADEDEATRPE